MKYKAALYYSFHCLIHGIALAVIASMAVKGIDYVWPDNDAAVVCELLTDLPEGYDYRDAPEERRDT